jgi:hypothetical protein
MLKVSLFILLILFFNSCSSKQTSKHFTKSDIETKAIIYTKKNDIVINNEIKLILWASYLNPLEIETFDNKYENFLISVYFPEMTNQDLMDNKYKITLNNQDYMKIKYLEKENRFLSSKAPWGVEYIVSFEKNEKERSLKLKIENTLKKSTVISFEK